MSDKDWPSPSLNASMSEQMGLKGTFLSQDEQSLIQRIPRLYVRLTEAGKRRLLPFASDAERRISELLQSGNAQKGKPSLIRSGVSKQLGQMLGPPTSKPSGTQSFVVEAPGWRLRTTIDYGGSHGQITYAHTITSTAASRPSAPATDPSLRLQWESPGRPLGTSTHSMRQTK